MIDYKKTIINFIGFFIVCITVVLSIMGSIYFWPFLIGIIIALILERSINFISKKTKVPRKAIGTIMVLVFYFIFAMIVFLLVFTLINELISLSTTIPKIYSDIRIGYTEIYSDIQIFLEKVPETISKGIYDFGLETIANVIKIFSQIMNSVLNFVIFLPQMLIYIIITFLATLFLVVEKSSIKKVASEIFPDKLVEKINKVFKMTFRSLGQYLRAQVILITITFVELFIMFVLIKQNYPLTLALSIAAIDSLPILGTGTILIPWSIYSLVIGNTSLGIYLFVIYVIILVVRQLVEPKIVSSNIGVHPFVTLLAMYTGFRLFGLIGLIIGPIVMVIFKNVFATMFEVGYFKKLFIYKEKEDEGNIKEQDQNLVRIKKKIDKKTKK